MTSHSYGKAACKVVAVVAGIVVYKLLDKFYMYGAYSLVHDLYNTEHGFIVIPGKTDAEGNWIKEDEK